jgi:Trk-type K+ transport system membrane component
MFTKADIEKYFVGEKQQALLFLIIGIAAVVTAIVFFIFLRNNFYKGAALPLLLVGLLSGIIGYTVHKRSDNDRVRNVYAYDLNPADLKDKELPRMKKVMNTFSVLMWVELVLLIGGAGLYIYYIRDFSKDFWRGFGIALAVMALLMLAADWVASNRGKKYTKGLEMFVSKF